MEHPFENEVKQSRTPDYPINRLILDRWSPRSMTGESLTDEELFPLFEAARWAPSSYNNQPWRFLFGKRDTPAWGPIFDLLIDFNKGWCKNAAALVVVISSKTFSHNGKPCRTHSFDTGAAWMALAIEAASRGLVAHGMEGFDFDRAYKSLQIPSDFQVEAMVAIGKRAPTNRLPAELQEREKPSSRKPLDEIAMEGIFRG